jgi:hypothetical protein
MTFRSVYNEERGGFGPLRAPKTYPKHLPSMETNENNEILFIDKIKHAAKSGCVRTQVVHSNALAHASALLDVRSAVVAMQCRVRSSVGVVFDYTKCVRTQITAHGAKLKR